MVDIRGLRQSKGLSGQELARRAKVSPSDLSRIERRLAVPYKPQARRIARALGIASLNEVTLIDRPD